MMALLPATAVATAVAQFPEPPLAPGLVADGVPGRAEQAADRFGHRHGV